MKKSLLVMFFGVSSLLNAEVGLPLEVKCETELGVFQVVRNGASATFTISSFQLVNDIAKKYKLGGRSMIKLEVELFPEDFRRTPISKDPELLELELENREIIFTDIDRNKDSLKVRFSKFTISRVLETRVGGERLSHHIRISLNGMKNEFQEDLPYMGRCEKRR